MPQRFTANKSQKFRSRLPGLCHHHLLLTQSFQKKSQHLRKRTWTSQISLEELCTQENITSFRKIKEKGNNWASSSTDNRAGGKQRLNTHTHTHQELSSLERGGNPKVGTVIVLQANKVLVSQNLCRRQRVTGPRCEALRKIKTNLGSPKSQLLNKLVLLHCRIPGGGDSQSTKWV